MATVIGPMLSLVARGSIGNAVTFKCGKFIAKKKTAKELRLIELSEQQALFKDGAAVWSEDLSPEVKKAWLLVGINNFFDLRCNPQLLALPFFGLLPAAAPSIPVGIIWKLGSNGYSLWISYYLTLGPGGWPNYPSPPPIGWVPVATRRGKTYSDQYFKRMNE